MKRVILSIVLCAFVASPIAASCPCLQENADVVEHAVCECVNCECPDCDCVKTIKCCGDDNCTCDHSEKTNN